MSLTITIPGAVEATIGATAPAVLTIGVGTPGATGPAGAPGQGVPAGGLTAQFLQKTSNASYATDWVTLPAYLPLAGGTMNVNAAIDMTDTTAGTASEFGGYGMAVSSASNFNLLSNVLYNRVLVKTATSQTSIIPTGVEFPDLTIQTTAGLSPATAASTYQTLAGMSSYLTTASAALNYAPIAAGQPTSGTVGQVLTKNSGTNYDSSWQTLIPGDRYLTSSTTSLTINNSNKTLTIGTGLSYTTQQDVIIAYDAAHHMHCLVTAYNSSTGVMDVNVISHTGTGTFAVWTVNVGGTVPLQSVYWGEVLGTLGDQSDLASALNSKLETSTAASTYQTISGMSSYAALSGATFTGEVVTPASTTGTAGLTVLPGVAPSSPVNGEIWNTGSDLQVRLGGVTETLAEQSWVTSQGYITSSALTPYAPLAGATFTGLVTTLAASTSTAGLNIPHGAAPTSPVNGDIWTTTAGVFWRQNGATKQAMNLGDTQTVTGSVSFSNATLTFGNSTAASTTNVGTGATLTATTKAINIGTNGVSGSTTNIAIGSTTGTNAITINGPTTLAGTLTASGATITVGNTTAASTLNLATGATLTATTKAVNIGTAGVAGSTTNIAIGSTTGTSTTTLQGTTNGVTAAADTNSVALATTAYVVGQAGSATPLVNGTAAVGTSLRYARQDHVHGTDTTRAPLASPSLTGTPLSTTAAVDTNTTQIATTAFVVGQASSTAPAALGTATIGTSLKYARADHVHPTAFAATSDVNAPSSTTLTTSPKNVVDMLLHAGYNLFYQGAGSSSTSGAGSAIYGYGGRWKEYVSPNAGTAGYALGVYDTEQVSYGYTAYSRSAAISLHDWTKKIWISGRCMLGHPTISTTYDGDANTFARISLGGYTAFAAGDMSSAQRGVGFKVAGGGAAALQLVVTNGTTVTTVTSSFTPTLRQVFDWKIYSDGAGNVTLYVNDSQVATTTAGPSTSGSFGLYMEGVDTTVSSTRALIMENFGTKIYHGV